MFRKISIDTIQLCAKLNADQVQAMFDLVKFRRASKYYNYIALNDKKNGEPFYGVYAMPEIPYVRRHYNTMVYLQKDSINDLPATVRDVIRLTDEWKVKRLDIAFDYGTPINKSLPLVKGNTTINKYNNGNYYLYSKNAKCKALCYDKARQLLKVKGIETINDWTRFEIRMKPPTLQDAVLCHWDFEWIEKNMQKFVWIPDIDELNLTKGEKDILRYTIKRRVDFNWKNIKPNIKKAMQTAIACQRIEFEKLFREQANDLFKWFWNVYQEHSYYTIAV